VSVMTFAVNEPSRQADCATSRNEDFALALVDGAFTKALEVHLVRKVPTRLRQLGLFQGWNRQGLRPHVHDVAL